MIPEPLLRVLPYPGFYLHIQELRGLLDIHCAVLVTRNIDLGLKLQPEPIVGQTNAPSRKKILPLPPSFIQF